MVSIVSKVPVKALLIAVFCHLCHPSCFVWIRGVYHKSSLGLSDALVLSEQA